MISDLRALLYVRSLRDKRVRASLFAPIGRRTPLSRRGGTGCDGRAPSGLGSVSLSHPSFHPSRDRDERTRARRPTRTVPTHSIRRAFARVSPFPPSARPTARHRVHVEPHPRPRRRRAPTNRRRNRPTRARSLRANERTDRGKIHAPLLANSAAFTAWENVNRVEANIVVE